MGRRKVGLGTDISWWRDRLEGLTEVNDGFMALCPAHDDSKPSLHLTLTEDPKVPMVHCFARCKYSDIYHAAGQREPGSLMNGNGHHKVPKGILTVVPETIDPLDQWEARTQVPRQFWEELGVRSNPKKHWIEFTWPWIKNFKTRNPWDKAITWQPEAPPFQPLWPEPTAGADLSSIILCEGERDTGILRYLGQEAYTVGSAGNKLSGPVLQGLLKRGVSSVTLAYDADKAGREGAYARQRELIHAGIECSILDISQLLVTRDDGWTTENDLGDIYIRVGDDLINLLRECPELEQPPLAVPALDYSLLAPSSIPWICKPFVARGAVTLLSGQPKAGKSLFTFKLVKEMLNGGVFLNHPVEPAKVMILTENSPLAFKAKMDDILQGKHRHVTVVSRFNRDLMEDRWVDNLRRLGQEARNAGCSVLVIDTLAAWARMEDENDASQVYEALAPIRECAESFDLGVLTIHHLTKSGEGPRGSGVFQAESDTLLKLSGEGGGNRSLDIKSILLSETPDPIEFVLRDGEYQIIDGTDDESKLLLDTLPEGDEEAITQVELMETIGMPVTPSSKESTRIRLDLLVRSGKVIRISQGPGKAALFRRKGTMAISIRGRG